MGSEINPQFAQIADENDLVVVSRFMSELSEGSSGSIDLIYPYGSLKPLRELLRGRVQTGDGNDMSDKVWSSDLHVNRCSTPYRTYHYHHPFAPCRAIVLAKA